MPMGWTLEGVHILKKENVPKIKQLKHKFVRENTSDFFWQVIPILSKYFPIVGYD